MKEFDNRGAEFNPEKVFNLYPSGPNWRDAKAGFNDVNNHRPIQIIQPLAISNADGSRKLTWEARIAEGANSMIEESLTLSDELLKQPVFGVTIILDPKSKEKQIRFKGIILNGNQQQVSVNETLNAFIRQINQDNLSGCFSNPQLLFKKDPGAQKGDHETSQYEKIMQLYRQREYIPTYSNEQIISNTPVLDNILNSSDNRKNYGATLGEIFENAPDEYKRLFADKLLLISKQPEALTELFLFSGGWSRNLFSKDRTCRDLLVYAVYEPRFIDSVLTNLYQNKLLSEKIFASEEIFFDFAVAAHGQSGGEFLKFFGLYRNTGIRQNDISDKLAKNFLRYRQFSAAQTETIIAILNNLNENELAMAIPLLFSGRINGYRQIAPVCRYLTRSNDKKNWLSLTDAITRHHILKAAEFT